LGGVTREVFLCQAQGGVACVGGAVGKGYGGQGVFLCKALRAAYCLEAAVWARRGDVELQEDGFSEVGLEDCSVLSALVCCHGDEAVEAVSAVQAQQPSYGAQSVCGVGVASVVAVYLFHPRALCVECVDVCSFEVCQGAEVLLGCHVAYGYGKVVIAAVFCHEEVSACMLHRINELPALLGGLGCRHFYDDVLAAVHGFYGYWGVALPVGAYIYNVEVGILANGLPAILACVCPGLRLAGGCEILVSVL